MLKRTNPRIGQRKMYILFHLKKLNADFIRIDCALFSHVIDRKRAINVFRFRFLPPFSPLQVNSGTTFIRPSRYTTTPVTKRFSLVPAKTMYFEPPLYKEKSFHRIIVFDGAYEKLHVLVAGFLRSCSESLASLKIVAAFKLICDQWVFITEENEC